MKSGTESKLKFKKLKRRLGLPLWQCIGLLESVWLLTAQSAPRGDLGRFSDEDIAASLEFDGDEKQLVAVLVETGWLDRCSKHRLVVHDWADHCPNYIKGNLKSHGKEFAQASCSKNVAEQAARQDAQGGSPPSQVQPSLTKSGQANSKPKNNEQNTRSRRCDHRQVTAADVEVLPHLDSPKTRQAIEDWLAYKRKRGQEYKSARHLERALTEFATPDELSAAVDHSIGCNYAGLFGPGGKRQAQSGQMLDGKIHPEDRSRPDDEF